MYHVHCTLQWHPGAKANLPKWLVAPAVGVRHATLNSQDCGWGPARHTELTGSQLRFGMPHWTHRTATNPTMYYVHCTLQWHPGVRTNLPKWFVALAVGVQHATLNSQDCGWGPARHTELTGSQLRFGMPHWTHRIAVGGGHATLNSQNRDQSNNVPRT